METFETVSSFVRQNEVGRRASVETPFGRRLLMYADATATGRYLHFVEAWIRRVRPFYANTHTAISSSGRIMTELREEARRVVGKAVNAGADDVVLFTGSGATAAINKLVGLLGLRISEPLDRQFELAKHIPAHERPVVFLGPYEHHSNELPWLESVAEPVEIGLTDEGAIDVSDLEEKLRHYAERPLKIGSFSAASNVTGLITDVRAIAKVLHRHGALACFDYAAAAPYVPIDMHPREDGAHLDAIYISAHKFIGGPQASGVLVAHASLFRTRTPERPGGGTVDYVAGVDARSVDYVRRLDEREEGGTPAIMGDIRAGVAFLVKEMVGPARIVEHEVACARAAVERLARHPRIRILGPTDLDRLAIVSFNIEGLHHDLVSALLDHLFGIQNRAGCSCAGPYGHLLLGIERATSERYRALIASGIHGMKPGWVRITIPFYASPEDIEFLLRAVEFVAERGQDFVPAYAFDFRNGVWSHIEQSVPDVPPIELTVEALREAAQTFAAGDHEAPMAEREIALERERYFREALQTAERLRKEAVRQQGARARSSGRTDVDELVWFEYAHSRGLTQHRPGQ
jgi:selenocysteine lyase/cysteine desulfurase